jgi:Helix-turn-helix domain of resolvase
MVWWNVSRSRRSPPKKARFKSLGDNGEGRARAMARGQKMGRPFKLTDHQKREAIKRHNQGETLADIARSYNVSPVTISRLTA